MICAYITCKTFGVIVWPAYYYAAVLIGSITSLARLSVYRSVCLYVYPLVMHGLMMVTELPLYKMNSGTS